MKRRPIPSWHCFEIIIRDALRTMLPNGDYGGLLMNRRLGTDRSTEADIIYGGKIGGNSTLVIVECKNRPVEVDGKAIFLPENWADAPTDIAPHLRRKAVDAQINLGFTHIRFLVVGATEIGFFLRISSECLVVGQPVQAWIQNSNKVQQYVHLEEAWRELTNGFEPLRSDSDEFERLCSLPKFAPWADPETVDALDRLREEDSRASANAYHEKIRFEELREQSRFLRQKEGLIEEGWLYPED